MQQCITTTIVKRDLHGVTKPQKGDDLDIDGIVNDKSTVNL